MMEAEIWFNSRFFIVANILNQKIQLREKRFIFGVSSFYFTAYIQTPAKKYHFLFFQTPFAYQKDI